MSENDTTRKYSSKQYTKIIYDLLDLNVVVIDKSIINWCVCLKIQTKSFKTNINSTMFHKCITTIKSSSIF